MSNESEAPTVEAIAAAWARVGSWQRTKVRDGSWQPTDDTSADEMECPLCTGDGVAFGVRWDATTVSPATLVGYGIGQGLEDAELLAGAVPVLLGEVERLQRERAEVAQWLGICAGSGHAEMVAQAKALHEAAARMECERDAARARAEKLRDLLREVSNYLGPFDHRAMFDLITEAVR